jgi:hypothetical protein
MPQLRFTEKAILKMQAPDPSGVRVIYWDATLRGFGIQCSGVSNAKTFFAQRSMPGGKVKRVKVGAVSELSLIEANKLAAGILIDLRKGIDLDAKARSNATLRTTLEAWTNSLNLSSLRSAATTPRTCPCRGALKVIIAVPMLNEAYGAETRALPACIVSRYQARFRGS